MVKYFFLLDFSKKFINEVGFMKFIQYLFLLSIINSIKADNKCELLEEKTKDFSIEALEDAAEMLRKYAIVRAFELDRKKDYGIIGNLFYSASYGNAIGDLSNSTKNDSLNKTIDELYQLDLPNLGVAIRKQGIDEDQEVSQRLLQAQKCTACLEYLAAKRKVEIFERYAE